MLSPFIKGLMCATLFHVGVGSLSAVIRALGGGDSAALLFGYLPGVLALVLAFSLFSRSQLMARLAFGFLVLTSLMYIVGPIFVAVSGRSRPEPLRTSLIFAIIYAFPCVSALLLRKRAHPTV